MSRHTKKTDWQGSHRYYDDLVQAENIRKSFPNSIWLRIGYRN